ncbi:N-acetyltransferase [Marinomonas agarivorans]|nr:N-acetyltransferase [Marinomonas agarivorans]
MPDIVFESFATVKPEMLLPIVNEQAVRTHLIEHARFTEQSVKDWIAEKLEVDASAGCRVRAVYIKGVLAGWCGIQRDENGFELAIVLSQSFWGNGVAICKTLLFWAKELGHKEVLFHLLESRPEYKALRKLATKVETSQLLGRSFTTYYIAID